MTLEYTPTAADVAALMRTRTTGVAGQELGVFDTTTRPTATEIGVLISQAASELELYAGEDIADALIPAAKFLVTLRTAMLAELSYWPEQVVSNKSPYSEYKALWDEAMGTPTAPGVFLIAVGQAAEGGPIAEINAGMPVFHYEEPLGGFMTRRW